ncbi:MAG: DUF4886 domain-containing protein [Bacteroidales bacterium]|nr:DUF4886 domain-containing protein [Bacteroidales bacterium]
MRKRKFILFILAILALSSVHAQKIFDNPALPKKPDTLKILGIGNSFTEDGMAYLPQLLESAGIKNVKLGKLTYPGCSLSQHYDFYTHNNPVYEFQVSGYGENKWKTISGHYTYGGALKYDDWDIVVIQQVSHYSGMWETYQPYLDRFLEIIEKECPKKPSIAWQMTWAYSRESPHPKFHFYDNNQNTMLKAIYATVKEMQKGRFLYIIPSATIIQSLRNSPLNNVKLDMTRDGYHLDMGAGRYAVACGWFEALIKPTLGISVKGNGLRTDKGNINVTDGNAEMIQEIARKAVRNPFKTQRIK